MTKTLAFLIPLVLVVGCMTTKTIPVLPPPPPEPLAEPILPPPEPLTKIVVLPKCPGPIRFLESPDSPFVLVDKAQWAELVEHLGDLHKIIAELAGHKEYPKMQIISPSKLKEGEVY